MFLDDLLASLVEGTVKPSGLQALHIFTVFFIVAAFLF